MKRFTQLVCVILAVAMAFSMPVYAAEQRSSDYFMKYSVYLWKVSDTAFEVWFDITAVQSMDELGASTIKVQRSTDEENWTTMQTYTKEDYSQMIEANTVRHADCVTYSSYSPDYSYRAIIVLYAKKGDGTGKATVVTPIL